MREGHFTFQINETVTEKIYGTIQSILKEIVKFRIHWEPKTRKRGSVLKPETVRTKVPHYQEVVTANTMSTYSIRNTAAQKSSRQTWLGKLQDFDFAGDDLEP